ncbi:MAG: hypothetical protein IH586_19245, partial [Anaerolineaceae bacterium]|nr:hypothetical protein [Anaerolineaceae bacterium]
MPAGDSIRWIYSPLLSMPQAYDPGIAVLLIGLGLVFFLAVRLMLKAVPHFRSKGISTGVIGGKNLLSDHGDAVLVIDVGGRIKSINPKARQIFRLQEGESPNIERLARKARPSESLIRLCACEGQARFILDGRLIEGSSYLFSSNHETTAVVSLRYPEITSGLVGGQGGL